MRRLALVLLTIAFLPTIVIAQDCIDYADDPQGVASLPSVSCVLTRGNLAYVPGNGLSIHDLSDPAAPTLVGHADGIVHSGCMAMTDTHVYTGHSFGNGLSIVDVSDPTAPVWVGTHPTLHNIAGLGVQGDYVYAVGGFAMDWNYLQVIDVSDPQNINVVATLQTHNFDGYYPVIPRGDRLLLANNNADLGVVDISDPLNPVLEWTSFEGTTWGMAVHDDVAYLGSAWGMDGSLHVVSIADPDNPVLLGSLPLPGRPHGIAVRDGFLYCGTEAGLAVLDVTSLMNPELVGVLEQGNTFGVAITETAVCSVVDGVSMTISYPHCAVTGAPLLPRSVVQLDQVAPNPFNPMTVGTFTVGEATRVTVEIVDVRGALVKRLTAGVYEAGTHRVPWDGRDASGRSMPSGSYLYRVTGGGTTDGRTVSLIK